MANLSIAEVKLNVRTIVFIVKEKKIKKAISGLNHVS